MIDNRRGQVTIFVIIALVIVLGTVTLFVVKDKIFPSSGSSEFDSVFDYYEQCISNEARQALDLAGSQGGRLLNVDYVPGSEFAPFSSHLQFLGSSVPYWYYITGNGLVKEQFPSLQDIANELEDYLSNQLQTCEFEQFIAQGYSINISRNPSVRVEIEDNKVFVNVRTDLSAGHDSSSARKTEHVAEIDSSFGSLYKQARTIYDAEKEEAFVENYSVDVLRLYAPVDGVELSCSPRIWKAREVVTELQKGLEANIGALKFKGSDYSLQNKEAKYFVVNHEIKDSARLLYSPSWPSKVEIEGADNDLLIAEPVGTQEGLGILGFCYAPYHFVYDVSFPVMVQVYNDNEVFQFPIVIVIDNNLPRQGIFSVDEGIAERVDVCSTPTQDISVNVYASNATNVDARVSYVCFNQRCPLGTTQKGMLNAKAPACLNGYLQVNAEGYREEKMLFSTTKQFVGDVFLDREYPINVSVIVGGRPLTGTALISFIGKNSKSVSLPDVPSLTLSEGSYNLSVYVYGNSSITIPSSTKEQCYETTSSGIAGLFGGTREECTTITLPETSIDYALIGGGKGTVYILENDLKSGNLVVNVDSLGIPTSLEQLHENYQAFETLSAEVSFT